MGGTFAIDLGPGFPDKTLPIAKHLNKHGVKVFYFPVDVSAQFLTIAADEMRPWVKQLTKCHCRFEELPAALPKNLYERPVACVIGLTFMNFEPEIILKILKRTVGPEGRVIIAAELITDRNSVATILSAYRNPDVQGVAMGPLSNLGITPEMVKYEVEFSKSRVEMWFEFTREPTEPLQRLGLANGHRILTAVSHRYHRDEFQQSLQRFFVKEELYEAKDGGTVVAICG